MDLRPCKPSQNNPKFANYTPWCAEVDFCSSAHIEQIVTDAIKAQMDPKIERRRKRQEAADKKWFEENG